MTKESFLEFFPQFTPPVVPEPVLDEYLRQATDILPADVWCDWLPEGQRLYVAHKCTLYLKTSAPAGADGGTVAGAGMSSGTATSKSVGGVSVSYSDNKALDGITGWGDMRETEYGVQLLSIARRLSFGVYVP